MIYFTFSFVQPIKVFVQVRINLKPITFVLIQSFFTTSPFYILANTLAAAVGTCSPKMCALESRSYKLLPPYIYYFTRKPELFIHFGCCTTFAVSAFILLLLSYTVCVCMTCFGYCYSMSCQTTILYRNIVSILYISNNNNYILVVFFYSYTSTVQSRNFNRVYTLYHRIEIAIWLCFCYQFLQFNQKYLWR